MVKPTPVGAHYGLRDWLAQRVTAVIMVLYTFLWLGIFLAKPNFDYLAWRGLFANVFFKLATFVFLLSLYYHAWVGMRDILMDYIKPVGVRLSLQVVVVVLLVAYLAWAIQLLWGIR